MRRSLPISGMLALVAGLALGPMAESDLFFRLKVGEEILRTGAIPYRNLFSFTYPDHPDLDLSWLFEVAAAALFAVGGFRGIVLGKALVLVATFAAAFVVCRRRGAGTAASALALGAAALVMGDRMVERPHLASFAGEIAILGLLVAMDRSPGPRGAFAPRRTLVLAGVVALWANLHAGVFLAPALLALHGVGTLLDRRRSPDAHPLESFVLAGVAVVAMLASPAGTGIFRYLWFHLGIGVIHPVDEFRAADLTSDAPLIAYAAAALAAAASTVRAHGWRHALPVAALALLAARSVRFGADFALVAAPLVAERLTALARRLPSAMAGVTARADVLAGALLLGLAVGPRVADARSGRPWLDVDLDQAAIPAEAIRFVEAKGLRERMYNDFEIGSYLAWQGYPRYRVFIDPRLPAYPEEFHRLMGRADVSRPEWDAALERYGVDSALLAYAGINRRVAWFGPERWALVYRKADARVFVRRVPRFSSLIAVREIPATFSFTLEEGTATVPLVERPSGSPVPDCEWQRRLGDLLFELDEGNVTRALPAYRRALSAPPGCLAARLEAGAHAWVAALDLMAGKLDLALRSLDRALALEPGDLAVRTNRALTLEQLGRADDARSEWARIGELAGNTPLGDRARTRSK